LITCLPDARVLGEPLSSSLKNSKHKISSSKMSINVGVIGTGNVGQDHIRRITHALSGAHVAAVTDIDSARAQKIANGLGGRAESTGQNVIAAKDVDAVIVTSIGFSVSWLVKRVWLAFPNRPTSCCGARPSLVLQF
jgi:hypothetical protein